MKNLLNPKWIFIINTLPNVLLLGIFFGEFQIIKSLLKEENISLWRSFGFSIFLLGIVNFGYAVYLNYRGKSVSVYYAIITLVCYIPLIYLYNCDFDRIVPFSIPRWMTSEYLGLYVATFLMPTLAYAVFVLIARLTPETKDLKAWKNFLFALIVPITWYLFFQVVLPLWETAGDEFNFHVLIILLIIGTLLFLFFLVRALFILVSNKAEVWIKYQLVWKIPISIILPIIGLLVNNGHIYLTGSDASIFGNFNNKWFYILAVLNGLFICLPNLDYKLYRLFLFIGRSILFSYTFYFFLVFLPFLPLSLVALIALGLGFLLLTPLLLFVIHIQELSADFRYLKAKYSGRFVLIFLSTGFLVIPIFITFNCISDRQTLNQTLEYVYSPDYSKSYNLDKTSLQKTLNVIKSHKNYRGGFFGGQQPYLSSYFNWLVLDNLTLSDIKIRTIESIFFGKDPDNSQFGDTRNTQAEITDLSTSSIFDKSQKAWKSWIDIEITNKNNGGGFSEYATTIELPEGAWISDYYLFVGDKKEPGILAEKRAAMWVFSNIRNQNRDPGILYYLTGNKLAFRVFPFSKNEVRKTGFEILHKEPISFIIDKHVVSLGSTKDFPESGSDSDKVIFVSPQKKQNLKTVLRKPYFHFLVNTTDSKKIENYTERIQQICKKHSRLTEGAKISFVNTYISTMPFDKNWQQKFQDQSFQGGFYIDRAIKSVLFNSYKEKSRTYPVIVVVTDSIQGAVFDTDFLDWRFAFPENELFYNLTDDCVLESHSLTSDPLKKKNDTLGFSTEYSVLEYKMWDNSIRYLPNNKQPSIVLKEELFKIEERTIKEKNWNSALLMQAKWMSQIIHPETSDKEWISLVKYSFLSKVMTPVSSYLVVENEAQKAILKKKQEQLLSGNKALDPDEDTQRMSEPDLVILVILLCIVLYYRYWKERKTALTHS